VTQGEITENEDQVRIVKSLDTIGVEMLSHVKTAKEYRKHLKAKRMTAQTF